MPKPLVILGSTGSIGRQALEVVRALPDELRVVGLVANRDVDTLCQQIAEFQPHAVAMMDADAAQELRNRNEAAGYNVYAGIEGAETVATLPQARCVLSALVGAAGLHPTLAAIQTGKDVALANKETLVAAGAIVMREVRARGVQLVPVDSEHSALFQCLQGEDRQTVKRLILTASGGPFVDWTKEQLEQATVQQALQHPNWRMGNKITVDSATLMNKGLEIIEAHWLFDVEVSRIEVLIHRQSVIHSLVEFADNSIKAQLGVPDMRLPIQYALLYPKRTAGNAPPCDLRQWRQLTFEEPDEERFPCLRLARQAAEIGGTMPAVMNAANEVAVQAFLDGRIKFTDIPRMIAQTMERMEIHPHPELSEVLEADRAARRLAAQMMS
ncbi:MAG: 1-deoxy-D-xylulose-5-phosphate reductoisomerase [Abditibacteriales bacterium]|nr:1-deoxy-D-xylulose-5-phosphate reductoisomerase [Abditibacteriales bacterium]MDW8365085.1 1-deoxy-D-xylulose-5-phosphate reductoisomerase [Abditibacteriales bacterium]